jgi:hypothetical protein
MNNILLIFIISTGSIILLESLRRISKSACSRISCCFNAVVIERNIELENSQKRFEIKNNYESNKTELPINIL